MSLEDFNKISSNVSDEDEVNLNSKKDEIVGISLEDIKYYMSNLDELLNKLNESYIAYENSKFNYDFKKNGKQVTINWNEENELRISNGLPKVSNKEQREAVIDLKVKHHYLKMKSCEIEYKMYKKIFDFIDKNFELLCNMYDLSEN